MGTSIIFMTIKQGLCKYTRIIGQIRRLFQYNWRSILNIQPIRGLGCPTTTTKLAKKLTIDANSALTI